MPLTPKKTGKGTKKAFKNQWGQIKINERGHRDSTVGRALALPVATRV